MLIVITGTGANASIMERKVSDSDWDATISAIAAGNWTDISAVYHMGLGGRDVLDIIAREVRDIWALEGEPLTAWQRNFIEQNISVSAANKFRTMEVA